MIGTRYYLKHRAIILLTILLLLCVFNYIKWNSDDKSIELNAGETSALIPTSTAHPPLHGHQDVNRNGSGGVILSVRGPTKIAFWIPPKFYVPMYEAKRRIAGQYHIIQLLNQGRNKVCRDANLAEFSDLSPCQFKLTRSVTSADAVVLWMFNRGLNATELPETAPGSVRVAFLEEPPPLSYWENRLEGDINWTMTYRKDSDVWSPFGKTIQLATPLPGIKIGNRSLDAWITGKTRLISAAISSCRSPSRRLDLIKEMRKTRLAPIDLYGNCGKTFKCGRFAKNCDSAWAKLGEKYRFFLAFENSICEDYITEKVWRTLEIGIVPVVYGGGNYHRDLPPNSFINVMEFHTPDELMKYLEFLGHNETEYAKYFEWRKTHRVVNFNILRWCSLCKAMQDRANGPIRKVYDDLMLWWQFKSFAVPACWQL